MISRFYYGSYNIVAATCYMVSYARSSSRRQPGSAEGTWVSNCLVQIGWWLKMKSYCHSHRCWNEVSSANVMYRRYDYVPLRLLSQPRQSRQALPPKRGWAYTQWCILLQLAHRHRLWCVKCMGGVPRYIHNGITVLAIIIIIILCNNILYKYKAFLIAK